MRLIIISAAALIIASTGFAAAQIPEWASYDCARDVQDMPQNHRTLTLTARYQYPTGVDKSRFLDPAETEKFVEELADKVFEACRNVKPGPLFSRMKQAKIASFEARTDWFMVTYSYADHQIINITNYVAQNEKQKRDYADLVAREKQEREQAHAVYIDDRRRQAEAEMAERARRDAEARNKKAEAELATAALRANRMVLQAKFGADLGGPVDIRWIQPEQLAGNPFKFGVGKPESGRPVVVMRTVFAKMVSPTAAKFGGFLNPMFVYNVPVNKFDAPDRAVMLAFKLKQVTIPGEQPFGMGDNLVQSIILKALADSQQPSIEADYVGAYSCEKYDCSDIVDPGRGSLFGIGQ